METATDAVPLSCVSKKRNNVVDSQRRKPDKTENQNCACSDEVDTICNYNMEHPRRGCAIIINNKNFENMEQRNGTEVDAHSLKTTLDKLAFDVVEHTDLSKDDMVATIKQISQSDHSDCDCLVVAILSHGSDAEVCGTDGKSVDVDSLTEYFHGDKCPSLVGKPKLFFIQSCRGQKRDDGVPLESDGSEEPDSCTKPQQRTPRAADILVFHSTVQGKTLMNAGISPKITLFLKFKAFGLTANFI
ncbi:caspase-3-like [Saccoglossus kowalevskii]|uniref:Caspase-3-like n=1 Tax=Saccoglossus kowalevskii TaxID=10224 RepID=A0ABM0M8Q8_SACKO|nr:PREDICTED: caspase-3-like [Saccoglossus kowalevskii]